MSESKNIPVNILFERFNNIGSENVRFAVFIGCVNDVTIEYADIPKLVSYFNDDDILKALKLLKIKKITSTILVQILYKCKFVPSAYSVLLYLIVYINDFEVLRDKMDIISFFVNDPTAMANATNLIKNIPIKNENSNTNTNNNDLAPPPYDHSDVNKINFVNKIKTNECFCCLL